MSGLMWFLAGVFSTLMVGNFAWIAWSIWHEVGWDA